MPQNAWLPLTILAGAAGCASAPTPGWVRADGVGLEERATISVQVSVSLELGGRVVDVVSMPEASALLQGRVAPGTTAEVQLAVAEVRIEPPTPPTETASPGDQVDAQDAILAYERWTGALLVPGLVAIGPLTPPPGVGSCAQVVLTDLARDQGGSKDLFELELALALLSGTMSPPAPPLPASSGGEPDPGRCHWRVTGQEGDVARVTTLTARMRALAPGRVQTTGVLTTLTTASYLGSRSTVRADTTLVPGRLFPSDGRMTIHDRRPLPSKLAGAPRAAYVYEITVTIRSD